jgi:hypothetical protein
VPAFPYGLSSDAHGRRVLLRLMLLEVTDIRMEGVSCMAKKSSVHCYSGGEMWLRSSW